MVCVFYTAAMITWIAIGLLPLSLVGMVLAWRATLHRQTDWSESQRLLPVLFGPLLAAIPLLGILWDRGGVLGPIGAAAMGMGPVIFALCVSGVLLGAHRAQRRDPWDDHQRLPLAWPVGGVILVLIASAGRVSHTVGLIACVMGLVLLWQQTIPERDDEPSSSSLEPRHTRSLALAFGLALVAGACGRLVSDALVPIAIVISAVGAAGVLLALANHRSPLVAMIAAGWLAVFLPAFGLGLMGQDQLIEIIGGGVFDREGAPPPPPVHETVGLLLPGLLLLVATAVLCGWSRCSQSWRTVAAGGLALLGLACGAALLWSLWQVVPAVG